MQNNNIFILFQKKSLKIDNIIKILFIFAELIILKIKLWKTLKFMKN